MIVAFRADASLRIGSGHVLRCATLARALRDRGAEVVFLCRELAGHYGDWLAEQGFELRRLPPPDGPFLPAQSPAHAAWLEVPPEQDAADCAAALGDLRPDWLVVDHYALDEAWEGAMRGRAARIAVIDDLADRRHDCDLLLDQNLHAEPAAYAPLLPRDAGLLIGPRFALLRAEFAHLRGTLRSRDGRVNRILVFAGGVDAENLTGTILEGLATLKLENIAVDVALGAASPHLAAVRRQCAALAGCALHVQTPDMARLMAGADLMLGGVGSATWERACLGLPAVSSAIAANQRPIGASMARARAGLYLGDAAESGADRWAGVVGRLVGRPGLLRRLGQRAFGLVDGRGAERVAAALAGRLRLSVLSEADGWMNGGIAELVDGWRREGHWVSWVHEPADLPPGDCAFLLGVGRVIGPELLSRNCHNLVAHASDLPQGRGWSPWVWQILEGKSRIPLTLFEAAPAVDSGAVYLQTWLEFNGGELVDELRAALAGAILDLCRRFVAGYPAIAAAGRPQRGMPSYYPRRRAADSRLDPDRSLREQFNLLRVVDNERYPAWFEIEGRRYILRVERAD